MQQTRIQFQVREWRSPVSASLNTCQGHEDKGKKSLGLLIKKLLVTFNILLVELWIRKVDESQITTRGNKNLNVTRVVQFSCSVVSDSL